MFTSRNRSLTWSWAYISSDPHCTLNIRLAKPLFLNPYSHKKEETQTLIIFLKLSDSGELPPYTTVSPPSPLCLFSTQAKLHKQRSFIPQLRSTLCLHILLSVSIRPWMTDFPNDCEQIAAAQAAAMYRN